MSEFIVSARKYRPDNFKTVVGQRSTTATLKNAIRTNHLAQAYLFCGPRGVGKTTCARIFAKTINCINITENGEACNECESCKSFNQNRSFNIHELDAASNNSVDDIRNLIDQVRIPPQISRYSVYIIDEVHMLSQAAFNAFLKTLEEPPKHAIFILATTEKHKIIPTILSRCQIFDFNRIKITDIVEYLSQISIQQNIEYEPDALNIIAQKADGSMRDALSIYDQIVSFSENSINYLKVIDNLNILDYDYFFRLTEMFLAGQVPETLLTFNEILIKGFDPHNFINGLSRHFRDLLVCKEQSTIQLLEVGESIKEKYLEQAKKCPENFLFEGIEVCNSADLTYRSSKNTRLHIELTLIKLCNKGGEKKKYPDVDDALILPAAEKKNLHEVKHAPVLNEKIVAEKPANKYAASNKSLEKKETDTPSILAALGNLGKKNGLNDEDISITGAEETEFDPIGDQNIISVDELLKYFSEFIESIKSVEPRMFSALKNQVPAILDGFTIEVKFQNNAQIDDFKLKVKSPLQKFLRENLKNHILEITENIIEDENSTQTKFLSELDKLKHFVEKNPSIQKLKQDFNLDFD